MSLWKRARGDRPRHYSVLLIWLFLLYILTAAFPQTSWAALVIDFLYPTVLLSAVYAVYTSRRLLVWGAILFIAGTTLVFHGGTIVGHTALIAFFCITIYLMLKDILRADEVTLDRVAGALSAYILLGILWTILYSLVDSLDPSAFRMPDLVLAAKDEQVPFRREEYASLLYYSFVTLTTLGYGDVTPVSKIARGLSTLEALTGQFYMAVLVASLVAQHLAHSQKHTPGRRDD